MEKDHEPNIYAATVLRQIRCRQCNRLLLKGLVDCVEIKCPKCHCVQRITRQQNGCTEIVCFNDKFG